MKTIFLTFSLVIFLFQLSKGQELTQSPLNDEFEQFITSKTKKDGIIPSPTTYVFSKDIKLDLSKVSFPSSYDLRDESLVTSVKNQGGAGHCWSFAAIGSIESRNLKLGLGNYDLSEHNVATCHGFEWEEGGNQSIATAYFSRLSGPVLEIEDPYSDTVFNCSETIFTSQFYVTESRFLPRDPETIKYILMNYGAIAVSYHHDDLSFNSNDNTYYYSLNEGTNHGVLLVGWDDNKSTNGGTGAWIIKNSWGSYWGENGYFYMSYQDRHAIKSPTIYPVINEVNDIDTLLMYDKLGEISSYGFKDSEDYALIKYTVTEEFSFNKIGTFIGAMNSVIDIEVFGAKTDHVLTDTLAKSYNNFCEFPGYQTFDIPFTASGDIYIKIKYFTPGDIFPIPVETSISDYAMASIESNVGWVSNHGDEWISVGEGTNAAVDLCIRAYGSKKAVKASFTSNRINTCIDSEVTISSTSSGEITNYSWDFGEGATPATATAAGPHNVSYSTKGFKTIKLNVENSEGTKDSVINYDFINVDSELKVNISPGNTVHLNEGDTVQLSAFGAESYVWSPESSIIGNINSATVMASATEDEYIYLDGTLGTCTGRDSVNLIITYAPPNDDVCDAIELELNKKLGPFTNEFATVEPDEPMPDTTGSNCETPGYWCSEGGLHNSVWFKFTAPNSGMVSVETDGFDNQIAIYEAENCADIVSGNPELYALIAANDDWEDADYSATIENASGMTPGKIYWLQMDGSAGGAEGESTITISETWPANVQKLKNLDVIKVYPNPSNGTFKVDLNKIQELNSKSTIDIIGMDGSLIQKVHCEQNNSEYTIQIDRSGMFVLRINTSLNSYTLPILIK